jgi:hypothetical protein
MSSLVVTSIKFVSLAALLYAGLCVALFIFQRTLLYLPHPPTNKNSAQTIKVEIDGEKLLVIAHRSDTPDAILYFGGNAEDVSLSMPDMQSAFPDHALYLPRYRGYGGSSGKPSEAALFSDALALFDMVRKNHQNITVIGRSLGSGVAVYLASMRPTSRLVLITPFDSIVELAEGLYPFFPVRWLLLDRFESGKYAAAITAPTRIIAAERDEVVPRRSTEKLFQRFGAGVADMKIVTGAGHNDISRSPDYILFLQGHL